MQADLNRRPAHMSKGTFSDIEVYLIHTFGFFPFIYLPEIILMCIFLPIVIKLLVLYFTIHIKLFYSVIATLLNYKTNKNDTDIGTFCMKHDE